ncbi:MAG TPA: HAMP domain-containing sensor histidine kinase [Candidatus Nanopelagicales bacterium]|nr:HAMP domain-containing sensor histidine kinase [Candidatus Nanopelagicales bacterium]
MHSLDDDFFARVGHDLRGELATMLAGVDFLLRYDKRIEPPHREMLERVRGAGERLRRLLDELNNAVWLRADPERPLMIADCDPVVLVQEVTTSLFDAAALRGARLLVDSELREGELILSADAEQLRVALEYVAGLSILRSRGGAVRLRLCWGEDGRPTVTIADEAGPVSPEVLERLFEPFQERSALPLEVAGPDGVPPPPRRRERLGLGLAIARGILEAHSGGLTAATARDNDSIGLRFTCTLGSATVRSAPSSNTP